MGRTTFGKFNAARLESRFKLFSDQLSKVCILSVKCSEA